MSLMPGIVQKPVTAHGGSIGTIVGVVIHVTAGEGDPFNEFANPKNQVSSHFGIGNGQGGMADGLIEQYVDTAFESWAQMAGNMSYISVETEGEPTEPLTSAQVSAFARIMVWAHQTYKVPLAITDTPGEPGLITHGDGGQAWGGHIDCPGPLRSPQRAQIIGLAAGNPGKPPPTTEEYTEMGDSVYIPPTATPKGAVVSHAVGAPGSPIAGDYLEITRQINDEGLPATDGLSIINITAEYAGFPVAP